MNWALWWSQIRAVIRLEMRKTFFAKRSTTPGTSTEATRSGHFVSRGRR